MIPEYVSGASQEMRMSPPVTAETLRLTGAGGMDESTNSLTVFVKGLTMLLRPIATALNSYCSPFTLSAKKCVKENSPEELTVTGEPTVVKIPAAPDNGLPVLSIKRDCT